MQTHYQSSSSGSNQPTNTSYSRTSLYDYPIVESPHSSPDDTRKRKMPTLPREELKEEDKRKYSYGSPGLRPHVLELTPREVTSPMQQDWSDEDDVRIMGDQQTSGFKREKEEKMEEDSDRDEYSPLGKYAVASRGKEQQRERPQPHPTGRKVDTENIQERVDDFLFFANSMLTEAAKIESPAPSPAVSPKPETPTRSPSTIRLPPPSILISSPLTPTSPQLAPMLPPKIQAITQALPPAQRASTTSLLRDFLDVMMKNEYAGPFLQPVDPRAAPEYYEVIRTPMDFGIVKDKVEQGLYEASIENFVRDVRLIFENALFFNDPSSQPAQAALNLSGMFEHQFRVFAQRNWNWAPPGVATPPFEIAKPKTTPRRITPTWTDSEDTRLKKLIEKYGEDYDRMAKYFVHKTPELIQDRAESGDFQGQDSMPRLRRNWSRDEDENLKRLVTRYGSDNWDLIASHMPPNARRSAAGCKNRWNVLESKKLDRNWTTEEENILAECWKKYGHQWSKYHKYLPNKPYFTIRKRALEIYEPSLA